MSRIPKFGQQIETMRQINKKSAEAPSEANASGRVDQGQLQVSNPNQSPLGEAQPFILMN